jgi:hypothetical protein
VAGNTSSYYPGAASPPPAAYTATLDAESTSFYTIGNPDRIFGRCGVVAHTSVALPPERIGVVTPLIAVGGVLSVGCWEVGPANVSALQALVWNRELINWRPVPITAANASQQLQYQHTAWSAAVFLNDPGIASMVVIGGALASDATAYRDAVVLNLTRHTFNATGIVSLLQPVYNGSGTVIESLQSGVSAGSPLMARVGAAAVAIDGRTIVVIGGTTVTDLALPGFSANPIDATPLPLDPAPMVESVAKVCE